MTSRSALTWTARAMLVVCAVVGAFVVAYDLVGYRMTGGDRICVVQAELPPAYDGETPQVIDVDIIDSGSGCRPGASVVCERGRILLRAERTSC